MVSYDEKPTVIKSYRQLEEFLKYEQIKKTKRLTLGFLVAN